MRTLLLRCVLVALGGYASGSAFAQARDAAGPAAAPTTMPATAPAAAPSTQPILDASARELVKRLQAAEARTGFRRLIYDQEGKIRSVFLSSGLATDENLRGAAHLPDLTSVRISCSYAGVSPEALSELRRLDHLEKLELRYAANRPVAVEYGMALARLSNLHTLIISSSEVDLKAVSFLCALPKLTTLELRACREFNDANVAALMQLRQLEALDLSYTAVSKASLDMLATLPHLQRVTLTGTAITEEDTANSKLTAKVSVKGAKKKLVDNPGAL